MGILMRGGKGRGQGRPPGSPNKKSKGWIKVATSISPEAKDYLLAKKSEGLQVNLVIDNAIKLAMAKDS